MKMEWQPIETAPSDTLLLVCHKGEGIFPNDRISIAWKDKDNHEWIHDSHSMWKPLKHLPTHWMPLPEPPNA